MSMTIGQSISAAAGGLARQSSLNYTADGLSTKFASTFADQMKSVLGGAEEGAAAEEGGGFEGALLKALDGVNAYQSKATDLEQQMIVDPDSVDAQDVTIAMAEANLSLNLAKTILSRVVTAWKDVINTR
jgi:flagellar hook-basal body complex protein FliE